MSPAHPEMAPSPSGSTAVYAAVFDLDGVLTDTTELHYRSWQQLAAELALPFDRHVNDRMRGLGRSESLAVLLGDRASRFCQAEKAALTERKNATYLSLVAQMTPADLLAGARELLRDLRARGIRIAVASSSRNAVAVVERLGIGREIDILVDGNAAPLSKPDPQVFLLAAAKLAMAPGRCVAIEDAEAGVAAALAAGMRVIGIGPPARVGRAHLVRAAIQLVTVNDILGLLPA